VAQVVARTPLALLVTVYIGYWAAELHVDLCWNPGKRYSIRLTMGLEAAGSHSAT
jgi:hypothetical protein